jgi:DNA-binding SARP family transcriptional activator/WD40 repeat protein
MGIGVLGPLELDGTESALGLRDRVVLQALAVRHGMPVSPDALAEALWGDDPPTSWTKVVQGCVVRLRKALGADAIETSTQGYRLQVHRDHLDHLRFEHLLERARQLKASGEPDRAAYLLREALELWRGEPLAELVDWAPGRAEAERLVELRHDAEDLLTEVQLLAGHHREAIAPALQLVHEEPMRERRWGLLALAQYQGGRQGDALQTLQQARRVLVDELGLDPGDELVSLERAILNQDPSIAVAAATAGTTSACPYLGLVAYDVADAPAFFGRDEVTAACLRRLDEAGVLAVVGPSGSGKSSLARAGIAAALERDGRVVHVLTPGSRPMTALSGVHLRPGSVLVIDQCEEALAVDEASAERTEFLATLVELAPQHPLVVTLRADRLGELAPHPEFARLVERGLYLLGPMTEPDLRRAIEGPAAQAGLRLEPGLVDLLAREVAGEPAALPLLSHVLRQTWRHREGGTLTVEGYAATGGVREAVAQSAEGVFRALDPTRQAMLRDLMLRLVTPDEGGDPVRTRVPRRSVTGDEAHLELVEQLVAARLLASDGDTVEIAHESLAVAWPRLRSWLDEDVDGLRTLRHLTVAAESWDELGRPDSELYRGVRQARAAEWHQRTNASLTDTERDFLHESALLADKEQRATEAQVRRERRLNQRLRGGLAAVAALLAVAIIAGAVALAAREQADRLAATASGQARAADARRLGSEALRATETDRSLLLAAAGVGLDDSLDTRTNLLATLDRTPALIGSARSAGRIYHLATNPATDQVAVMAADGVGLELYDGRTLGRLPAPKKLVGGTVVARPDGQGYAISIAGDLVEGGQPPILLLDRTGARSAVQLGGLPPRYQVLDLGFPRRWYLGFSPTSRWFATSLVRMPEDGKTLTFVWDLHSPERPAARLELGWVGSAATISPDGRTLYSGAYGLDLVPGGKGQLLVTNLPTGTTRRTLDPADLAVRQLDDVLAQSPDGRTLAVGAGVEVVLVDTATLKPRAHLSGQGATQALAFSADGTQLAASGDRLTVWDLSADDPVVVLSQVGEVEDPAFSRDGRTLYTKTVAGLVQAWDLSGDRRFLPARRGQHLDWPDYWPKFSPDRSKVAYVANGPKLRIRDVATGRLGPEVAPKAMAQGSYNDVAWHPDSTIVSMTSGDPWVRTWDATTGRELAARRIDHAASDESAAASYFSRDGKYLLVGTTEGRIHVLDARTLVPARQPIQVHEVKAGEPEADDVWSFVASGDGHTAYLNDAIVDYVAGTVRPMPDLGFPVVDLYPSPDGKRLIVGTGPTGTGLLDATTMRWISRPSAAQAGLVGYFSTTWSDDGTLVASVNEDGRVTYWDGRTGDLRGTTTAVPGGDPAFSPDDQRLLVAADDSVLTWDLDPRSWVAAACRRAGRPLTEQEWDNYLPDRPFEPVCAS